MAGNKLKTRKSFAKRFKVSANGKIMRNKSGKRHLLASKSPKRRRNLGQESEVDATHYRRIRLSLPNEKRL
ncbi:MAG TPA: 50S ribosomal protein L35 [Verrucomicrobiales bacterium]|nr:50S ribosomal protein L35 [Verrucomicrobiales bacterium]HIL69849.1 50S ribosomal protein L35 [Verrucomicrobiota bacterium]